MNTLIKNQPKTTPRIISILAMSIAALSEPISEYLEQIKDPTGIFSQMPMTDPEDWLEMYRRLSRLRKMTRAILVNFDQAEKWTRSFYNEIARGMNELNLNDSQIKELNNILCWAYKYNEKI